jgi:hypothetical protein
MDIDLQAKMEKYEGKAAKYREAASKAAEGAQRSMLEVLANYYGGLATDFRQAAEKRKVS